jgi:hypothetical protein
MKNGASDHEDRPLDALVRAAAESGDAAEFPVDEQTLLAYLAGQAGERDAARIRSALAGSAFLRGQLAEMAADLERLESAETAAAFETIEVGTAPDRAAFLGEGREDESGPAWGSQSWRHYRTDQPSLLDLLRSLFLKPAFAYAFTIALLAYPTYRYFTASKTITPLLQSGRTYHLQTEDLTLRGGETAALPPVSPEGGARVVSLALWSETPLQPGARYEVVVSDERGEVWRQDDVPLAYDPANPTRIDLRLDTSQLEPGRVVIRIIRRARDTGDQLLAEEFAFRLD